MRVRDHGAHSSTRIGIEAFKTDISLTEENFFFFHLIPSRQWLSSEGSGFPQDMDSITKKAPTLLIIKAFSR